MVMVQQLHLSCFIKMQQEAKKMKDDKINEMIPDKTSAKWD